jgi:transcriptional regulator with PAS, ATPase and Fis domain
VFNEEQLKLFDYLNDSVLIYNRDGRLVFTNKVYEDLLGITREYARARVWGKHLSEASIHYRDVLEVIETGVPKLHYKALVEKAGAEYVVNIIPWHERGETAGVIIIGQIDSVYKLLSTIIRQRKYSRMEQKEKIKFKPKELLPDSFKSIVGNNISFVRSLVKCAAVADSDSTILLIGESGVGKDLLARAIHNASSRAGNNFVVLNCAAIPEHLMESELFGYEPGAFTGADKKGKPGKMYLANKGTLFLDEIGDMPLSMQAKLLRAIQYKQFERIGGTEVIETDIRFIAATNKDLVALIEKNLFREDLYYRINVIPVYINPLRERMDDMGQLCRHFLDRFKAKYRYDREIILSPEVIVSFQNYHWPGNVRELMNTLEHAVALVSAESGTVIKMEHLPASLIHDMQGPGRREALRSEVMSAASRPLKQMIAETEEKAYREALHRSPTRTEAIKKLGVSRRTFYKKLREFGLQ